jgi:hypothetical protein
MANEFAPGALQEGAAGLSESGRRYAVAAAMRKRCVLGLVIDHKLYLCAKTETW